MTLTRLFTWLVLLLATLGSAAIVAVQLGAVRSHSQTALAHRSSQQAAMLAQALYPSLKAGDVEAARVLARDAVEGGVIEAVRVASGDAEPAIALDAPVDSGRAPPWFVQWVRGAAPVGEASEELALDPPAQLRVRAQIGDVYTAGWDNLSHALIAFLAGALVMWLAAALLMRALRADLRRTERQLVAAAHGRFGMLEVTPRFNEVQPLVAAGNTLVHQVARQLDEANELADRLRQEAYSDPVTRLANRRALELRLESTRSDAESCAFGALLLARTGDLREFNERFGIEAGDALLRQVGEVATQAAGDLPNGLCARLGGADIAVFAPCLDPMVAGLTAAALADRLVSALAVHSGVVRVAVGAATYSQKSDLPRLIGAADAAARRASDNGTPSWSVQPVSEQTTAALWDYPDPQWRMLLEEALAEKQLTLVQQPILASSDRRVIHYEVFVRLMDPQGRTIPAGVFMPAAERLGLSQSLDRAVLELVMAGLERRGDARMQYAVNLSSASVVDPAFSEWLCQALLVAPQVASSLIIELSERGLSSHLDSIRQLVQRIRGLGASVSLDHFGMGYAAVGYLRGLGVDCVKLDAGYARGIERETDNRNTVRTLVDIGRGLRVKVYAQCVESEAEWAIFKACEVDGGGGFWLGRTEPFNP